METPNIELLEDRILVKPFPVEEKSEYGLVNPLDGLKKPSRGEVLLVGKRYQAPHTGEWIELYIKPGDIVDFDKHSAVPYSDFLLLRQGNCISITQKNNG